MAKYAYPAVFEQDANQSFNVSFPDLPGCYTCGETLAETIEMAADALALMLYHYEEEDRPAPKPSALKNLSTDKSGFLSYIACDTIGYRKRYNNKAVKKTLSIPEWLNELAIDAEINFSQVLQDALKQQLQTN